VSVAVTERATTTLCRYFGYYRTTSQAAYYTWACNVDRWSISVFFQWSTPDVPPSIMNRSTVRQSLSYSYTKLV